MAIPVEASEVSEYTPESLTNLADAPVFRFRPATERDMRTYRRLIAEEGLNFISYKDLQDEVIASIEALWSEGDAQPLVARYRNFLEMEKQAVEIAQPERDWAYELMEILMRERLSLRLMAADRSLFSADAPKVALRLYLAGWKRFNLPFRLEGGYVAMSTIDAVERKLQEMEAAAIADQVEGAGPKGLAFMQLSMASFNLLNLTGDEEKNSPAPSPTSSSPEPLATTSDVQMADGASTAESAAAETTSSNSPKTKTQKRT